MLLFQTNTSGNQQALPGKSATHYLVKMLLYLMAACFNFRPSIGKSLQSDDGWMDYTAAVKTRSGSVEASICFKNGRASVSGFVPDDTEICLVFKTDRAVRKFLTATPTDQVLMILKNDFYTLGNASYLNLFVYCLSLLLNKKQIKMMARERSRDQSLASKGIPGVKDLSDELKARKRGCLTCGGADSGVKYLDEPYLSKFSLEDFPRLEDFLNSHFETRAEVCPELPELMTLWHKKNGYKTDSDGKAWNPILRKGLCYKYIMENRRPIIHVNDLIAGTSTTKEVGVIVYPEGHGTMIWGELFTVPHRSLNPYDVSPETRELLHHKVFPYWADRNFKEWVRKKYDNPLCQQIDERFAVYFDWKSVTISHTIPDFPKILSLGTRGIIDEIKKEMACDTSCDEDKTATRQSMILCMEGLEVYSKNLALQASKEASETSDKKRRAELENLAGICTQVVSGPARTLEEAVNAMWITWVGIHMESTNAGMSLGRLDQWLQPYFERDMEKIKDPEQRQAYIKNAIELVGCFMMRCTDHLPLTPDFANYYFGGSSSDQAITLGGVTPEGEDAVNDMTYIFLKVTEMLALRDPNVNARVNEKNSDAYLKRLCEVNLVTAATPSMHNDKAVWKSLEQYNYGIKDLRNWSATGCVEPTLSGKHMGHTNFQMISLVAALEMALNNGLHPLMGWELGPCTGIVEKGDFKTFDQFFKAFEDQLSFLIDQSIQYNELLAEAHQDLRPTPLLSTLVGDCVKAGKDVTKGGARYNSSGAACIGLADITDSMLVIKRLVFDERTISFPELKQAIDTNFENHQALHATVTKKVPLFGSGDSHAVAMANRITRFVHGRYNSYTNYRGGPYTAGFWSMSNHVAYGTLCGALPSGRLKGKPFTPGLTPQPSASTSLLDNLRDVAGLAPENMSNNIAFNVKVVPGRDEPRDETVGNMASYVKSYFKLGGMQMQMNVVTSDMLKDAMAHPENYRNLLVRISGYNAYFVTLNKDMQMELIERAEYSI